MSRLAAFVAELRRRRVFRVAAFYGGIAFVIVQIIDGTFEVLGVPPWVSRLLIVLLAAGFPVAMGLAWVFDITSEGIVRTDRPAAASGQSRSQPGSGKPLTSNRALIVVAILAVAFGVWSRFGGNGGTTGQIRSIAVLPLDDYMGNPDQAYFVDGMTEAITSRLSQIAALKVIARTSVMQYAKSPRPPAQTIAEQLGVDGFIEGSVFGAEGQIRIDVQLIDGHTGEHIWSNSYERDLINVMALQSDVALAIAAEIGAVLTPDEEARLTTTRQVNPEAYQLYLRARDLISSRRDKEALEQALEYLNSATRLDPDFVEAYAEAVVQHMLMYWFAHDPTQQRLDAAKQALDAALRLAPDDPAVLVARGRYYYHGFRDYTQAITDFNRALALAPSNADAHTFIGAIHRRLGDFEEALSNQIKGFELDPGNAVLASEIGGTYRALKDLANAQAWFERSLELSPELVDGYSNLAYTIYLRTGRTEAALAVLDRGARFVDPGLLLYGWADLEYQAGRYAAALEHATAIPEDDLSLNDLPKTLWVGILYDHMGQADSARHYLNLAQEELAQRAAELVNYTSVAHIYTWLGLIYAYQARESKALEASAKADELLPLSKDAFDGVNIQRRRAEILTVLGQYDEALDILADLLGRPGQFVINELVYKREWEPLRSHPRYGELVVKYGLED